MSEIIFVPMTRDDAEECVGLIELSGWTSIRKIAAAIRAALEGEGGAEPIKVQRYFLGYDGSPISDDAGDCYLPAEIDPLLRELEQRRKSPWVTDRPPTVDEVGDRELVCIAVQWIEGANQISVASGYDLRREWRASISGSPYAWLPGSNKPLEVTR